MTGSVAMVSRTRPSRAVFHEATGSRSRGISTTIGAIVGALVQGPKPALVKSTGMATPLRPSSARPGKSPGIIEAAAPMPSASSRNVTSAAPTEPTEPRFTPGSRSAMASESRLTSTASWGPPEVQLTSRVVAPEIGAGSQPATAMRRAA